MNVYGLLFKFPTNRRITEEERTHQLLQKETLNVKPHYQLCVIKANSTYLESVDKWFGWKGELSAVMTAIFLVFAVGFAGFVEVAISRPADSGTTSSDIEFLIFAGALMLPMVGFAGWAISKEAFAYTHYPIRFNRRTRKVHVFKPNGIVTNVRWDEVFFTLGHNPQKREWEIRGLVLDHDRTTVLDTFALSYVGGPKGYGEIVSSYPCDEFVLGHWEFIRRYMEEGPESVLGQVQFCMPVDGRRETVHGSIERMFANIAGAPLMAYWFLFPFHLIFCIFRLITMRTCKVPEWPSDVEAACLIDEQDPFAIVGAEDGERVAVFPDAAAAAGVRFRSPPRDGLDTGNRATSVAE